MDRLPLEMVLLICNFAACCSFQSAISLSLVSVEIRRHTVNHLYSTILLHTARQVETFLNTLRGSLHDSDNGRTDLFLNPAQYVRNLCITYSAPPAGWWSCVKVDNNPYAKIFEFCSNVERAALQSTFLHSSLAPDHPVHKLNCKELTVIGPVWPSDWESHAIITNNIFGKDIDTLGIEGLNYRFLGWRGFSKPIQSSIFKYITHLHLLDPLSSPRTSCTFLSKLPCLTHVALPAREPMRKDEMFWESTVLLAAPQMEMIVLVYNFATWVDKTWNFATLVKRGREMSRKLFFVDYTDCYDPLDYWLVAMNGGEDIWTKAQRIVRDFSYPLYSTSES